MQNSLLSRSSKLATLNGAILIRSLWDQLNELRGFGSSANLVDVDMSSLKQRFSELRDEISAYFAYEWGMGPLSQAVFHHQLSADQCELLRAQQFEIFDGISTLSANAEELFVTNNATHASMRALMDRFRKVDSLLIAHESRKNFLLRGVRGSMDS